MTEKFVRVGAGVIALNDKNQFILGKRKGSHGSGSWSIPGGHLEFRETLEECGKREVFEETGLIVDKVKPIAFRNHIFDKEDKHYISIFMIGIVIGGELEVKEPNKCEGWHWFDDWNNLPKPTFGPYNEAVSAKDIQDYLKSLKI